MSFRDNGMQAINLLIQTQRRNHSFETKEFIAETLRDLPYYN